MGTMEGHPELAHVQMHGLHKLVEVEGHFVPAPKDGMLEAGGITAVVRVLTEFPKDAQVQTRALKTLNHIVNNQNEELRKNEVIKSGGIELIVSAMKGHLCDHKLQEHGCSLLWSIGGSSPKALDRIVRAEGIETV